MKKQGYLLQQQQQQQQQQHHGPIRTEVPTGLDLALAELLLPLEIHDYVQLATVCHSMRARVSGQLLLWKTQHTEPILFVRKHLTPNWPRFSYVLLVPPLGVYATALNKVWRNACKGKWVLFRFTGRTEDKTAIKNAWASTLRFLVAASPSLREVLDRTVESLRATAGEVDVFEFKSMWLDMLPCAPVRHRSDARLGLLTHPMVALHNPVAGANVIMSCSTNDGL